MLSQIFYAILFHELLKKDDGELIYFQIIKTIFFDLLGT